MRSALRNWLLDRLEARTLWEAKEPLSCARLAERLRRDADFMAVLTLYLGRDDFEPTEAIQDLAVPEAVPHLAAYRYTESDLRKREDWERTWELQRAEDRGEKVGEIQVPPKYASADFQKSDYCRHRGKLDVPKERFILYPHAEREADGSALLGWAGWNHLERAQALAGFFYAAKENEGWGAEHLKPLLAGLVELVPWLKQWHNEPDPEYGRLGDYYETLVREEARELGLTWDELKAWKPEPRPARRRGSRRSN